LSVQDGINIPSANKKSLILISFVLIAFLVTGCGYKNSDLLTIPNDKKMGKGLYDAIKYKYKYYPQDIIFLSKIEPEYIEFVTPIFKYKLTIIDENTAIEFMARIAKSGLNDPTYESIYIQEVYSQSILYTKANSYIIDYDKNYHSCLSIIDDKKNAIFGPIYVEVDKRNNNILSILAIVHYNKLEKPDKMVIEYL